MMSFICDSIKFILTTEPTIIHCMYLPIVYNNSCGEPVVQFIKYICMRKDEKIVNILTDDKPH